MAETIANRFFFFPLFLLLSTAAATSNNNSSDFIRRSCSITLYPRLCYASLAPYATAVQQNPAKLATAAATVSLAKIHDASLLAATLQPSCAGRLGAAMRDCVKVLGTAADLTKQSAAEMGKVGEATRTGGSGGMAWEVSNAQTWMSAAMTNEETCIDGFDGVSAVRGAKVMADRVGGVKKYTSNALALLNVLAHGS
ncbi:pectinesterase inhibitor 9-like [Phalaenopsis equestris]|uniref:pectinesterase inhibitor 9-like n=1 Tax=Phalaenopsis equestris TaxID=78828 RepID=UPI0009E2700E|nr:pectinesterase inhibitor 9-like [Phalaenopsis equestris]